MVHARLAENINKMAGPAIRFQPIPAKDVPLNEWNPSQRAGASS
jgi:hypothetical protein